MAPFPKYKLLSLEVGQVLRVKVHCVFHENKEFTINTLYTMAKEVAKEYNKAPILDQSHQSNFECISYCRGIQCVNRKLLNSLFLHAFFSFPSTTDLIISTNFISFHILCIIYSIILNIRSI